MFKLSIKTDNAAFHDVEAQTEIIRILRAIIGKLDAGHTAGSCMDANGNTVGTWSLKS